LDELVRGAYTILAQKLGESIGGGKTAQQIVEAKIEPSSARLQMLNILKTFVAPFALSQDAGEYSVVGAPVFSVEETYDSNQNLVFDATWTLLPKLELSSYGPIELKTNKPEVTEAEIDEHIKDIAESYKTVAVDDSKRLVEPGDIIQIRLASKKDGAPFEKLCFDRRLYRAGSTQMPEGFDTAIEGAFVGDIVLAQITLPIQQAADGGFTGPVIDCEIEVLAIMKEVVHELTDDFVAQNIPNASSVSELRNQSKKELEAKKSQEIRHMNNFMAAEELSKRLVGTIPDAVYDALTTQMEDQVREQAASQGMSFEDALSKQGTNEQQFRLQTLMQAKSQLRQSAALDAWARHNNIQVDKADLQAFFESSVEGDSEKAHKMQDEIESGGYLYLAREGARRLKTSDAVVAQATFVEA
jgi:trigger factor